MTKRMDDLGYCYDILDATPKANNQQTSLKFIKFCKRHCLESKTNHRLGENICK